MADKMWNGMLIGTLLGVLVASSSISFIQSIVSTVNGIIPLAYQFQYSSYVIFGLLGFILGWIIDKK